MSSRSNPATGLTTSPFSYTKYSNSPLCFDITLHFGPHTICAHKLHLASHTICAHKLHLASHSRWFEIAFTRGFSKTTAPSLTLHDDDPAALIDMLKYVYDLNFEYSDTIVGLRQ
jgi:hypothetical protein